MKFMASSKLEKAYSEIISKAKKPSGVKEMMKVYERFEKAYAVTEQYLELVSPKTYQTNSNKSIVDLSSRMPTWGVIPALAY